MITVSQPFFTFDRLNFDFFLVDAENVFGVLHYAGASSGNPTTKADDFPSGGDFLQEHQLAPLENPGAPGGSGPADRVIDLSFTRTTIGGEEAVRSLSFVLLDRYTDAIDV